MKKKDEAHASHFRISRFKTLTRAVPRAINQIVTCDLDAVLLVLYSKMMVIATESVKLTVLISGLYFLTPRLMLI